MADFLSELSNVFSGGPVKSPKYVPLDPQSQALLDSMQGQAQAPASEWAQKANKGVETAGQLGQPTAPQDFAKTGINEPMGAAIRNAYKGQANQQIGNILKQNEFNAQIAKANYSAQINNALLGQAQTHVANYQLLTDAYNQNEAARAQFVASLTGLAAYGMGTYMAKQSRRDTISPDQQIAIQNQAMFSPQSPGIASKNNIVEDLGIDKSPWGYSNDYGYNMPY